VKRSLGTERFPLSKEIDAVGSAGTVGD